MCTFYFENSMTSNIFNGYEKPYTIKIESLEECAMIIAAKRHRINLGINSEPYPQFGNLNPSHHEYFQKRIAEEFKKRRMPYSTFPAQRKAFNLSWINDDPETLRFIKLIFRQPETLEDILRHIHIPADGTQYTLRTSIPPHILQSIDEFKRCRRQFVELDGLKENHIVIAANFLGLTLPPYSITNILNISSIALYQKKSNSKVMKHLGIKTPMNAIIAWAKLQNIPNFIISNIEQIERKHKKIISNTMKVDCISIIHSHLTNKPYDITITASKIRNYYQNSKKMLDGRCINDYGSIRIYLETDLLKKLDNHIKITKSNRSMLIENLLLEYFNKSNAEKINPTQKANVKRISEKTPEKKSIDSYEANHNMEKMSLGELLTKKLKE